LIKIVSSLGCQHNTPRGRNPNGRCTTNSHRTDRLADFAPMGELPIHNRVGQATLIEQIEVIANPAQTPRKRQNRGLASTCIEDNTTPKA
jgi:hypothetical protein